MGGGKTCTGLHFERGKDVASMVKELPGYKVLGEDVFYGDELVAKCMKKHGLYRFLQSKKIDYTKIISKKILPDDAVLVLSKETLYIIEMKYQQTAGSVDEKLQTCDFKRKQYAKLMSPLGIEVEYVYLLNDWFRKPEYKDVLDYIVSVGCHYYFDCLPLEKIGLPT